MSNKLLVETRPLTNVGCKLFDIRTICGCSINTTSLGITRTSESAVIPYWLRENVRLCRTFEQIRNPLKVPRISPPEPSIRRPVEKVGSIPVQRMKPLIAPLVASEGNALNSRKMVI